MIFIGDTPILTSISEILFTLRRVLQSSGSYLLHDIIVPKYDGQDIMITCPFHKNGVESKPSCGITTVEKKRNGKIIPVGTYGCFTCKSHGDITELISFCFGKKDAGIYGKKWIFDNFDNFEVENRQGFFRRVREKVVKEKNYVKEEELQKYRFYHPYMYKRGLTDEIIDIFDIGYDDSFKLSETSKSFGCIKIGRAHV